MFGCFKFYKLGWNSLNRGSLSPHSQRITQWTIHFTISHISSHQTNLNRVRKVVGYTEYVIIVIIIICKIFHFRRNIVGYLGFFYRSTLSEIFSSLIQGKVVVFPFLVNHHVCIFIWCYVDCWTHTSHQIQIY